MKALAQLGARARVSQLQEEINELQRAFPDLGSRDGGTASRRRGRPKAIFESAVQHADGLPEEAAAPVRKRKPMTAAQKKAVGERMKKYWAARRKSEKRG